MVIYLICFAISAGFAFWANRTKKKELFYLFSCLSILVMVLLAGLRDYSVGIDTMGYKTHHAYWHAAINSDSLIDYFKRYFATGYFEPLFALLVGVIAQITKNFSVLLIAMHAVIITGIYVGSFRLRKYVEPAWILLLYYLFLFNQSLNLTRQHMVMAIVFMVFADIQKGKYWRYCIVVVLASLVHTTALLALLYPVLYFVLHLDWAPLNKKHWARWAIMIGLVLMAIVLMKPVATWLIDIGIFSQKYAFYFRNDVISPALIASIYVAAGLGLAFYFRKLMAKQCEHLEFWSLSGILYFLLLQFSWSIIYGKRFSLYCALPYFALIALVDSSQTDQKKKWIVRVLVLGASLAYWLYIFVLKNASETVPYQFCF